MRTTPPRKYITEINNSIDLHLEELQRRYSKILPLRIDFSYKKDTLAFQQENMTIALEDITIFMALSLLRTSVIGYYWVMEYTPSSGYHFHTVFYLNGQNHRNTYQIATELITLWKEQTHEEGKGFIVKRNATYFHVDGLQMLSHDDETQRRDLLSALGYFAKTTQKQGGLYSGMNAIEPPSGRGRPRKTH